VSGVPTGPVFGNVGSRQTLKRSGGGCWFTTVTTWVRFPPTI